MKRPLHLALLLVLLVLPRVSRAMVDGGANDPEWFTGATNKILILEYDNPFGGPWGKQLAQLIGRTALATVSGLDSFAVITLRQQDKPLDLTPETVETLAKRQRTPVVIWGEFYEQKDRIFVTSHLRYVPSASPSNANLMKISWDISRLGIPGRTRAYASVPTSQVNFAPIEISRASLVALQSLWSKTLILRDAPNDNASQTGELTPDRPYYVLGASNGWTRLTVRRGNEGWVRLTELSGHNQFKDIAGVVLYGQGMMQHLAGKHAAATASFKTYLGQYAPRQDSMNQAMAHILLGYSYYQNRAVNPVAHTTLAWQQFQRAKELLPESSSPVNCLALALFNKATQSPVTASEIQGLEKSLIHVIQAENDLDAVRNLQVLYSLPGARDYFKNSTADFAQAREKRLNLLKDLEQKFRGK